MKQAALLTHRTVQPTVDALAALDIGVHHHWGGGVYCKETTIPRGMALEQHAHEHSHLSVLMRGRVRLERGNRSTFVTAPAVLTIRAGEPHRIVALEASIWLCLWREDAPELRADPTLSER